MQKRQIYIQIILLILALIVSTGNLYAQSEEEKRALWVFNIAYGVKWQNQDAIDEYTIGIYSDKATFDAFKELAKTRKIHEKSVNVVRYRSYKNIQPVHILFITKSENGYADIIYKKLKGKNVLTISDRIKDDRLTVINFLPIGKQAKSFTINVSLANTQKLKLTKTLLKLGGSEEVLRDLYSKSEKDLREEQKKLEEKRKQIKEQQKLLDKQFRQIKSQNKKIKVKEELILEKETELKIQSLRLDSTKIEVLEQKKGLIKNLKILTVQERKIREQQKNMQIQTREMHEADKELKDKQAKIAERDKELGKTHKVIENQQDIIYLFIVGSAIIVFLTFLTLRGYYKKQKINNKLNAQNIAINKQKEEIVAQSKQMELINTELEKLSIVASKTDNAVTIIDAAGDFEWVNAGFTRMYGYTLQLLRNEMSKNIVSASKNDKIENIFKTVRKNKETIIYENLNKTRTGEDLWVQTTLNPILSEKGKIEKFITIDTDITKLKDAESEIRKKSEELMAQQEELKQQNARIDFQNKHIRSSIQYAKTIQTAILPSHSDFDEMFNSFIIFRPKDIVSGDFYWYAKLPAKDGLTEKVFVAAVDCTGHGVPGAFMSLVSSRLLNEIVLEHKILSPDEILETLDKRVNTILRQDQTDNHDGMDLTLCRIEPIEDNKYTVKFAGAKRPINLKRKNSTKLETIKGTRRSIGGIKNKKYKQKFKNNEFQVQKGDYLWLATDGYIDQNNNKRKRFGTPRFERVLNEIKNMPIELQKNYMVKTLDDYQGNELQRDDITVIGIELK